MGSNGTILQFRKGGADSGSIGAFGVQPYFAGPNSNTGGIRLDSTSSYGVVIPTTVTGANRDAATDLGYSSGGTNVRFRDLYLSGTANAKTVTLGSGSSDPGILYINDNSGTAYTLALKGTGGREYTFEGSSSGGEYNLYMNNASVADGFNLHVYGAATFNQNGDDFDFRVESNNLTNALFVDGADGTVTASGQFNTSSGASKIGHTSQRTAISGTTNTTIVTSIIAGFSSAAAAQVIVYGSNNGANAFMDTLNCMGSQAVVVAQSSTLDGSPHGRTYAISGANLNVQLASGASGYAVNCSVTTLNFPF